MPSKKIDKKQLTGELVSQLEYMHRIGGCGKISLKQTVDTEIHTVA